MSSTSFQLNNEIIRAGAGAGKTTTLTKKVIQTSFDFYHIHRCFPRMVVTTFSRKATQELRERLVVEGIKTDREDFLEYISSRSSLHISTIHGVLSLFLRRYGHLLNIDSGFQIIGETDATLLAKGVLRQLLLEDPEQNQILETWSLRDLTHMLRGYHSALMADPSIRFPDVPALYQLLTQYLERNCETLKRAVEAAIEETTISSWKEYLGRLKVISERLRNLNSMDDWNEVKNLVEHLGRKPPFSSKRQGEAYSADLKITIDQAWKELSDKMKKPGLDLSSWLTLLDHGRSFESLAQEFHQRFLAAKEKSGRLEMSDLEFLTWQKLQAHPEIGAAFSQDWDYWLIDEFQDTSPLQVELLRCLIGDRQSFLVGDPQQSIYLFRGARSEVFQQKWNEIGANGGVLGEKRTNFRSTPALLHFFNEFFSQVGDQFQPMEAKSESHSSSSLAASTRVVATFAIAKQVSGGEEPEYSEMAAIVSHIYELREEGVGFEEICVLGRTNQQLEEVARTLRTQGFPVHLHAATGFYRRREISDCLSLVRFLLNPRDNANLIAVLRNPFMRVDDQQLSEWMGRCPDSLWAFLEAEKVDHPSICRLRFYLEKIKSQGLIQVVREMILREGWFHFSLHYDGTGRREANIWKWISQLEEVMRGPGARFLDIGSGLGRDLDPDGGGEESDAVTALEPLRIQLMTVHSSKGLQFPHVILPGCGSFQQVNQSDHFAVEEASRVWGVSFRDEIDDQNIVSLPELVNQAERKRREELEHQRLLYVALTRAKESVLLTWSESPRKGSWATLMDHWVEGVGDSGHFYREHFSYCVSRGPWPVKAWQGDLSVDSLVRDPLDSSKSNLPGDLGPQFSVSQYLEEKLQLPQLGALFSGIDDLPSRVQASSRGILIHRLMETLHYNWNFDFTAVLDEWFGSSRDQVENGLNFIRLCQQPPLSILIPRGHVEWGFQVATPKGVLEGQIDLWGQDENGEHWLIDYKSGSDKYLNKAIHQLNLYSFALRRLGVSGPIHIAVVYPLDCQCHIQKAPSESELQQLFPELF